MRSQSPRRLRHQPPLHKGAEAWVVPGALSFPEGYQLSLFFHAAFGRYEKSVNGFNNGNVSRKIPPNPRLPCVKGGGPAKPGRRDCRISQVALAGKKSWSLSCAVNPPDGCAASPLYTRGPRRGLYRARFLSQTSFLHTFFQRPKAATKKRVTAIQTAEKCPEGHRPILASLV